MLIIRHLLALSVYFVSTTHHLALIYPLQDIGASGTNAASVALDATLVTSVLKHGYDAGTGAVEGYQTGSKGV